MKKFDLWQMVATVLIFCLVLAGFLWNRSSFYFFDDDYGAFYSGKNFKSSDFKDYFGSEKLNDLTILPSNLSDVPKSFFSVTYRPMALLLYALECTLFNARQKIDAWPYFVTGIALHAFSAALIFVVLSFWISMILAFLAAICFAFYPFMGLFIGRFSIQPFSICFILGLFCAVLFYRFLKSKNYLFLLFSGLLFSISVFVHEIIISLPIWLALLAFYEFLQSKKTVFKSLVGVFFATILFFLILLFYLALRVHLFPIDMTQTTIFDPVSVFSRLVIRFYDFVTLKVDMCGLSWISSGHALLKSIMLLLFAVWYSTLLLRAKKNGLCLLLTVGVFVLAWPSLLIMHQARYLYLALPLFLATIALCADGLAFNSFLDGFLKSSVYLFFIAISVIGFFENRSLFGHAFYRFKLAKEAISDLANRENFFGRTIFFIGLPHEVFPFSGLEQALSIFSPKDQQNRKIIYEPFINVNCFLVNCIEKRIPEQNLLKIKASNQSCQLETTDKNRVWINYSNPFGLVRKCSTGSIVRTELYSNFDGLKACKIAIKLNNSVIEKKPVFVTWDYEKKRFVEVGN